MQFIELKKSFSQGAKSIYYLDGDDSFLRGKARDMIKAQFLSEPDLNLSNFDGAKIKSDMKKFLSALQSMPFMSEYRVVSVVDWSPTAAELKNNELKSYFASPNPTTILIIDNSQKCEGLKKFETVTTVNCKKGDVELIRAFILAEAARARLTVSRGAIDKIIDYCQGDMARISSETAKLISFVSSSEIVEADVDSLVVKDFDYKVYEMVEFIAQKNNAKAYEVMNELMETSEKQMLLVSLYKHFSRLLHISISQKSLSELAVLLDVKPYAVQKAAEQSRRFTPKRLIAIVTKLANCDADFKSGKMPLDSVLTNAVFNILTEN